MAGTIKHHQQPEFFVRGLSPFVRLIICAILSLVLIALDSRFQVLREIKHSFLVFVAPLEDVAHAPADVLRNLDQFFTSHKTLIAENNVLRQKLLLNSEQLQRFNSLTLENERLRNILHASEIRTEPAVMAEIIHVSRNPFSHKVVINRGEHDKITSGQGVIDDAGVVGQVTNVYPYSSEVTLINDSELSIPVQVERNGLRAIAFGTGKGTLIDLPYLPINVDVREGDRLVTSGIDGTYPAGLLVAVVKKVETSQDSPFAHIVSEPAAAIDRTRLVLVVAKPQSIAPQSVRPQETKPAAPATEAPATPKKLDKKAQRRANRQAGRN